MSRPTISSKGRFLEAFRECGGITKAAELVGINRVTVFKWRRDDPKFAAAFADAQVEAAHNLEDEARRRAVEGSRRYRFKADGSPLLHPETGLPYFEEVYSDALLVLLLKAHSPKFRALEPAITTGAATVAVYLPENHRDGEGA